MSDMAVLIDEIQSLPPDLAAEVLDFVGYLKQKSRKVEQGVEKPECGDVFSYRTGFLKGQVSVPLDFDTMGQAEIAVLFGEHP